MTRNGSRIQSPHHESRHSHMFDKHTKVDIMHRHTQVENLVFGLAIALLTGTASPAFGQTFSNADYITINDGSPAAPYPSTIEISGLTEPIESITVSLFGLHHTYPDDVDILLVAPSGETVMLMSDAGGSADVYVYLTFMDGAPSLPDGSQIDYGTYSPGNFEDGETLPPPAPAGPYGSVLSAFAGTDGNGTWSLYVFDDAGADIGFIADGWSITITAQPVVTLIKYQGRVNQSGVPLDGTADFEFTVYDAATDGTAVDMAAVDNVAVTDGLFTVELSFRANTFDGQELWLQIAMRSPAGDGAFQTLDPRQHITPAPQAIHAHTTQIAAAAHALHAPGVAIDAVIVDTDGNIGIGTTAPEARLHVASNDLDGTSLRLDNPDHFDEWSLLVDGASAGSEYSFHIRDEAFDETRMTINDAGRVGIGTTTPEAPLHVASNDYYSTLLRVDNPNHANEWALVADGEGNVAHSFHIYDYYLSAIRMTFNSSGGVGIGTINTQGFTLAVNGSAAKPGGGSWSNYSDARLKTNLVPMTGTLDRLLSLHGYAFEYTTQALDRKMGLPGPQIGLIAQEVEQVFPDWVDRDDEG